MFIVHGCGNNARGAQTKKDECRSFSTLICLDFAFDAVRTRHGESSMGMPHLFLWMIPRQVQPLAKSTSINDPYDPAAVVINDKTVQYYILSGYI
jgi:hypothetical protein